MKLGCNVDWISRLFAPCLSPPGSEVMDEGKCVPSHLSWEQPEHTTQAPGIRMLLGAQPGVHPRDTTPTPKWKLLLAP